MIVVVHAETNGEIDCEIDFHNKQTLFLLSSFIAALSLIMVWGAIKNAIGLAEPTLPDGPTRLPPYFPVEPKGCEKHAQKLFNCLSNEATTKAREMERTGLYKPYFSDVTAKPTDPRAAQAVAENPENPEFPKAGDNPLDECRSFVAYYKQCCDKKLKQKKNWILTEHVRVQEEYRYKGKVTEDPPIVKSSGS